MAILPFPPPSLNGFGEGRILAHIRLDNATREGAAAVPGKGRGSFEIKPITPPLLPLPLRCWGERGEEKPSANCSMFFPLPSPWSQTADVAIVRKRNELPASPSFSPRPFLQTMQAIYLGQFAQHLWQRGEGRGKLLRHSTTQRRNLDGAFSTPSSAMSLFHPSTLSRSEKKQKSNFFPSPLLLFLFGRTFHFSSGSNAALKRGREGEKKEEERTPFAVYTYATPYLLSPLFSRRPQFLPRPFLPRWPPSSLLALFNASSSCLGNYQ